MGLLRSEAMAHGVLVWPSDKARRVIEKIGREVSVQFEDMNAAEMRRPYRKFIQRIDEMERILRFIFEEVGKLDGCNIEKNHVEEFLKADTNNVYQLDTVEKELSGLYTQMVKFKSNNELLTDMRNKSVEEVHVVSTAVKMLGGTAGLGSNLQEPLLADDVVSRAIGHAAGVISLADKARFERAIWKVSHGNALYQFEPIGEKIIDPKTGAAVEKVVFVVYYQGEQGALKGKIDKVCAGFGANMYAWPASAHEATKREVHLRKTLADQNLTLHMHHEQLRSQAEDLLAPCKSALDLVGAKGNQKKVNSKLEDWRLFCIKEKSVYTILNMCQDATTTKVNVWYPETEENKIKTLISEFNGSLVKEKSRHMPPTYIRTNEYTQGWQDIINTYGIPKYQEANPALLTCVTFPFIFGMMYGDIGHGSMLLCAGIYLVQNADRLKYTMPAVWGARYMVFSMGIFALYAGFMYNDFFSVSLPLFTSGFKQDPPGSGSYVPLFDALGDGCPLDGGNGPYPFGLDPAWGGADNELIYVNSLKMKLSVLFGVLQMFVGVCLRWSNAIYFKSKSDFIFECLPMMVFLCCFFGWMDVMILYKWVTPIDNPPNIINSLITMAMGLGISSADKNPLWDGSIQLAMQLMQYTIIAVPIMLLPKPFVLLMMHKRSQNGGKASHDDEEVGHSAHGGHGEEFEFGEVFIHQVIETIEFVLGTVSHTASYLRIWALSLAHQQLSLVFFQKTLTMGLEMDFPTNGIALYFLFAAWFGITCGVLLGMDVLECFLHTLRLHWVEFQSKFYNVGGNGEEFAPYEIKKLIATANDP